MIPAGGQINNDVWETEQPSTTWRLDLVNSRIAGKIGGLDAIRQAVFKILQTERYKHLIYSSDYGSQMNTVIGQSGWLQESEIRRRIREALTQDDRIRDITDITIQQNGDKAIVSFTVISSLGTLQEEVMIRV